jgi:hypothetical protein
MDLVNPKVLALIPAFPSGHFEETAGSEPKRRDPKRGQLYHGILRNWTLLPMLKVHCDPLGKDRSMLVATGSTDDEAFHSFKVQVQNHQRHAVLE